MNLKIVCNKCGKNGLEEYRMAMMNGPKGYRSYSVCMECGSKFKLRPKGTGGKQRAAKRMKGEGSSADG